MEKNALSLRRKRQIWFCLGALVGLIAFLCINTGASLDVTYDSWIRTGYAEKDVLQHYTGWLFYRSSPLGFPLGMAQGINGSTGCAVSYTDSIPLLAIFFRFFAAWLPQTFQYFGWYTLACYLLQGGCAALLLTLFTEKPLPLLAGTVLLTCSPIMLERSFRHMALAAHFLLLLALYLYLQNRRGGCRRAGYLALLALATTLHPYFLPMLFAIFFADLLAYAAARRSLRAFGQSAAWLLGSFAVVLATGYSIGIFSSGGSSISSGYGYFCMNLNALFCPVSPGGYVWSRVLTQRPQGLGSADGFNYLGLGVLCALPVCAVIWLAQQRWAGVKAALRRHWALVLVCACLTVFAVSSTVLYCNLVIVQIPLPQALLTLCSTFRSSGRMFWPVYYLLVLFVLRVLAGLSPRRAPWLGAALLAAVLAVQLWDISPALAQKRSFWTEQRQDFTYPLDSPVWDALSGRYDTLCSLDVTLYQAVYPAYYAATAGMATNDGWAARFDVAQRQTDTKAAIAQLEAGEYDPDTVYITSDYSLFIRLARALDGQVWAVQADDLWYLLIPKKADVQLPAADDDTAYYPDLPLILADFSNDDWSFGVQNTDHATCLFYADEATARWLDDAAYLVDESGAAYAILSRDDQAVPGYLALTLDLPDAAVLAGQHLTTR